jgi:predicted alpha/beta-fold hydrolase
VADGALSVPRAYSVVSDFASLVKCAACANASFLTAFSQPSGGLRAATDVVPHTANSTLAEGEFNRFYIRAMCRRAEAEGRSTVLVYRAAERDKERSASVALIGQHVDAAELLAKLRELPDFKSGFPEPNTGLSVTHS